MDLLLATHYLPFVTTALSVIFFGILFRANLVRKSGPHLAWWAFGALCYGAGTLVESVIALHGNTAELTKAWYITGALLGGFPLAQGAAYLHMKRRTATIWGVSMSSIVVIASILVCLSPVIAANLDPLRPSGHILGWSWIRLVTPIVNTYSLIVLVGGAIVSAVNFKRQGADPSRVTGNVLIAIGGLLPGIGGSLAIKGWVEALYVLELVGLILMWMGYAAIARLRTPNNAGITINRSSRAAQTH